MNFMFNLGGFAPTGTTAGAYVTGSAVTGSVAGGTANPVITAPANLQDGDLIIIVCGANADEDASGATLNGFTILTGNWISTAAADGYGLLMYKIAASEGASWTFTALCPNFNMGAWGAVAYRGVSGTLDNSSTGSPVATTTPALAAMTPNVANCIFVAAYACDPTAGLTSTPEDDPACSERFDAIDGALGYAYLQDYTQSTPVAAAPSITASVSDEFVVFYLSLAPA